MLRFLLAALPARLFGYRKTDFFDDELVCVHVYHPAQDLPAPLTDAHRRLEKRPDDRPCFNMGLPELVLCEPRMALLDLFQYFWPISRQEVTRLQHQIEIRHKVDKLLGIEDLQGLEHALETRKQRHSSEPPSWAVILTLNDDTRHMCPRLVDLCKKYHIDELIIFKDPSQPPYLCSYPSRQKGFKKPPPMGGGLRNETFV
jgi:hypothetical protein